MKITNGILSDVHIDGVTFKVDLVPEKRLRRPGTKMTPLFITIHNTGCDKVEADNFRRVQLDPSQDKEVSWHLTVGSKEIIQSIPLNEVAWHAGNRDGNYKSIGIEICEVDGAEENAIKFVAQLLECMNLKIANVRTHKSWSGKQCPWKILPHWNKFLDNIVAAMDNASGNDKLKESVAMLAKKFGISEAAWNDENKMNLKFVSGLLDKLGGLSSLVKDQVISDEKLWRDKKYQTKHVVALLMKAADKYCVEPNITHSWVGYTTANLNARQAPDLNSLVSFVINKGEEVLVKRELTMNDMKWYAVQCRGFERYVAAEYVERRRT